MNYTGTHESLFIEEVDPHDLFEKEASIAKMPDDEKKWPAHLLSELHKQLPFLSGYDVDIALDRLEPEAGYGLGYAMIRNKSTKNRPAEDIGKPSNRIKIPLIVADRQLQPFHTFELGENIYPLTKDRMEAALTQPAMFDGSVKKLPRTKSLVDQLYPPYQQRQGFGRIAEPGAAGIGGIGKSASAPIEKRYGKPMSHFRDKWKAGLKVPTDVAEHLDIEDQEEESARWVASRQKKGKESTASFEGSLLSELSAFGFKRQADSRRLFKGAAAEDAPNYRQGSETTCAGCKFFRGSDDAPGQCSKYDFQALPHYTCDSWVTKDATKEASEEERKTNAAKGALKGGRRGAMVGGAAGLGLGAAAHALQAAHMRRSGIPGFGLGARAAHTAAMGGAGSLLGAGVGAVRGGLKGYAKDPKKSEKEAAFDPLATFKRMRRPAPPPAPSKKDDRGLPHIFSKEVHDAYDKAFDEADRGGPEKYKNPHEHASDSVLSHPHVKEFEKKHGVRVKSVDPGSSEGVFKHSTEKVSAIMLRFSKGQGFPGSMVFPKLEPKPRFRAGVVPQDFWFYPVPGANYYMGVHRSYEKKLTAENDPRKLQQILAGPMRAEMMAARGNMPSPGLFILVVKTKEGFQYIKPTFTPALAAGGSQAGMGVQQALQKRGEAEKKPDTFKYTRRGAMAGLGAGALVAGTEAWRNKDPRARTLGPLIASTAGGLSSGVPGGAAIDAARYLHRRRKEKGSEKKGEADHPGKSHDEAHPGKTHAQWKGHLGAVVGGTAGGIAGGSLAHNVGASPLASAALTSGGSALGILAGRHIGKKFEKKTEKKGSSLRDAAIRGGAGALVGGTAGAAASKKGKRKKGALLGALAGGGLGAGSAGLQALEARGSEIGSKKDAVDALAARLGVQDKAASMKGKY